VSTQAARRSPYRARIARTVDHNTDTRSLFLRIEEGGKLSFIPGQFISVLFELPGEKRVRPYTIASDPEEADAGIEICFNQVPGGIGVRYLFERKTGDVIEFTGPFGAFTMERAPERECIFIAESTGIAPIRPMLRRAMSAAVRPRLHLLYAAPDSDHLLYRGELEAWAAAGLDLTPVIAPPRDLYSRMLAETERRWVAADSERSRQFYICGAGDGVLSLRDLLRGAGYERRAVHYERW
jgi:glycine betaine monooxygenase B